MNWMKLLNIGYLLIGILCFFLGVWVIFNVSDFGMIAEMIGVYFIIDSIRNFKEL